MEFSLVAPIFFAMLTGLIGVGWLYFQSVAVANAARAGAREATIETSYANPTCESGKPDSIEHVAQLSANIVQVDQNPLCATHPVTNPNELFQVPSGNTATITLTAHGGGLSSPTLITVTVTYYPLPFLFGRNLKFESSSTLPPEANRNAQTKT